MAGTFEVALDEARNETSAVGVYCYGMPIGQASFVSQSVGSLVATDQLLIGRLQSIGEAVHESNAFYRYNL